MITSTASKVEKEREIYNDNGVRGGGGGGGGGGDNDDDDEGDGGESSNMDRKELEHLLAKLMSLHKETEWVEFKEAKTSFDFNKLGKYFSALSNEANLKNQPCGWLIFGVNNQIKIVGTQYKQNKMALDRLKSDIAQHTTGNISFIEIYELTLPYGRVILFQIPPAPKGFPVAWRGHWYGRNDDELCALNIQELEYIRNQAWHEDWSAKILNKATLGDLDPNAILKAREQYKVKNPRIAADIDEWNDITFLNKANILKQDNITTTAIVLLGKEESEHFLSPSVATISWILQDNQNVKRDYTLFGPPFLLNVDRVFGKIRNLKYRHIPDNTLFPTEIDQYDPWVIREALHNCIAHQDYTLNGRIIIVESPEKLVFTNLGSFIPGSVEAVIEQDSSQSFYRNHFLAQAMVNLNMIDTIGSGIKKMFVSQIERLFPLPDYDLSDPNKVILTIHGKIIDENYTRLLLERTNLDLVTIVLLDKVQKSKTLTKQGRQHLRTMGLVEGRHPNLHVSSKIARITGEKAKHIKDKGFDDEYYQKLVIAFIKKYGSATRKDIDELLMDKLPTVLSPQQKANKINSLLSRDMAKKLELIKNIGSKRASVWVLTNRENSDLQSKED